MSTNKEKLEAIKYSLEITNKRIKHLETLRDFTKSGLTKAQQYELDMCYYTVKSGDKLLGKEVK